MSLIILKIGGSVITEKGEISKAREVEIERISQEIVAFRKEYDSKLILVHGAGSFGHPQAVKFGLSRGFDAEGTYLTHISVKMLNSVMVNSLNNAGAHALPVHPLSSCLLENGKIIDFQLGQIVVMLENGIIPVLHGDMAMDRKKGACVLSGDRLIAYLAVALGATKIGAGTDVDGVLDEKDSVIEEITPRNFAKLRKNIRGSRSTDVTGGMLGKVSELLELAHKGISSRIFNAAKEGMVLRFLSGDDAGTLIINK